MLFENQAPSIWKHQQTTTGCKTDFKAMQPVVTDRNKSYY